MGGIKGESTSPMGMGGDDSDVEGDSGHDSGSRPLKRSRADDVAESSKQRKKARVDSGATLAKSNEPISRNAQVWFSQGLFKDAGLSDIEDEEDDEDEDAEMDEGEEDSGVGMDDDASQPVRHHSFCPSGV